MKCQHQNVENITPDGVLKWCKTCGALGDAHGWKWPASYLDSFRLDWLDQERQNRTMNWQQVVVSNCPIRESIDKWSAVVRKDPKTIMKENDKR
jgi:hypothetical protein